MFGAKIPAASFVALAFAVPAFGDEPGRQPAELGRKVQVAKIAPAVMGPDGMAVRAGPWRTPAAGLSGCDDLDTSRMCLDVSTPDDHGMPRDPRGCGNRWYHGHGKVHNPVTSNGFELGSGAGDMAERIEFAWDWAPKDKQPGGKCEPMLAAAFTADGVLDDPKICPGAAYDPDTVFEGFMVRFVPNCDSNGDGIDDGVLDNEGGGYYYADVCLRDIGLSLELPEDGEGAFVMQMLTCEPKQGEEGCVEGSEKPATGSQPVLWDTLIPGFGTEGIQSDNQHDDRDGDGKGDYCYDGRGVVECPDVLGQMYVLYGQTCRSFPGKSCGEHARVKAKCKRKGQKVVGKLRKADKNVDVTFRVAGQHPREKNTGSKGKARAKWRGLKGNQLHPVTVCDKYDSC